jgi:hypothetical protein
MKFRWFCFYIFIIEYIVLLVICCLTFEKSVSLILWNLINFKCVSVLTLGKNEL